MSWIGTEAARSNSVSFHHPYQAHGSHPEYPAYPEHSQNPYGPRTRTTDAPVAMDMMSIGEMTPPQPTFQMPGFLAEITKHIPQQYLGVSGYLVAGIFLGLVLIGAVSLGTGSRSSDAASAGLPPPSANAILDNVVRLHARDIGNTCWAGIEKAGPARLTVALEVGVDGRIRYAAASGESPAMRECVETHVKSWEFLPQAQAQTMALPFEVDRR